MRESGDVFHLAIPVDDLQAAETFYVDGLGCKLARRYSDRITLDFFGDQLVCHLSDKIDPAPDLYPRHFGITFHNRGDFDRVHRLVQVRNLSSYMELSTRFEGLVEEHLTFVVKDPANNLIEFKHYLDPRMAY
jgi:extradiol dioxygenase family protein